MTPAILAEIWFCIVCVELALYFVLDGANLGIGILSLLPQEENRRDRAIRGLGPIWNANETWLLVAAGTTFGAFPMVYSIGLNALFIPAMIAGVGLIVRAISFAYYEYAKGGKHLWGRAFAVGSLLVAIGHGCLLGGLVSGIAIEHGRFAGGMWDWASGITVLLTIGIVASYMVLGYARLLQEGMTSLTGMSFLRMFGAVVVTLITLVGASFLLPVRSYTFFERWTMQPTQTWLTITVLAITVFALLMILDLSRGHTKHVYTLTLLIFAGGFVGMIIGTYPYIIPDEVTIFEAASPANTLMFMLYGIGPLLPIVFAYNWYLHRVFKGEWRSDA